MEQNEEMMILKSDIAIVVKKDGTTLIQAPTMDLWLLLFTAIGEYIKNADAKQCAEYCASDLIGREAIKRAMKSKIDEFEKTAGK